jgi:hypothetical protein
LRILICPSRWCFLKNHKIIILCSLAYNPVIKFESSLGISRMEGFSFLYGLEIFFFSTRQHFTLF